MGKPGSFSSSPRRRRGGGYGTRLGGVERGGGIQRGGEWGQGVADVPRVAVGKQELACGPPRRRAALNCAGAQRSREGERRKKEAGLVCKF